MASHTSILTWGIPWREEPGGYSPRGGKESDMTEQLTLLVSHQTSDNSDSKFSSVQSLSHVWLCDPMYRLPCPSPTCEVCLNPCQLSWWCHPTISSSVIPLSSCPQSFSTSGSFPMSQFFTWGGQSTGASASASVLPMNTQDWFPLGGLVWSSYSLRDSQESFPTPEFKSNNSLVFSFLYVPTLESIHDYWKNHRFD